MEKELLYIIIHVIELLLFLVSLVLILFQYVKNYEFYQMKRGEIILERTLFEQLAAEVYENIRTYPIIDFKYNYDCDQTYEPVKFHLKANSYFDCRKNNGKELIDSCRGKIIKSDENCHSSNENSNLKKTQENDPKIEGCTKFSSFTTDITNLFNEHLCIPRYNIRSDFNHKNIIYEELLENSISSDEYETKGICPDGYRKCGILDTMNNTLCLPNEIEKCPLNKISINGGLGGLSLDFSYFETSRNIIISIILSEDPPLLHEWTYLVMDKYKEDSTDKNKLIEKRKKISPLNYDDLFKDQVYDDNFTKVMYNGPEGITLNNIFNWNYENKLLIEEFNNLGESEKNKVINIYTKPYIGFKNVYELEKFKKIFNEDDMTDNPLYKLSTNFVVNPLVHIIISAIFMFIILSVIIIIILFYLKEKIELINKYKILYICLAIIFVYFFIYLILIIIHYAEYKKIDIDMDKKIKKVLDLYNKRIKQNYLLSGIVIDFASMALGIFGLFYFNKITDIFHFHRN